MGRRSRPAADADAALSDERRRKLVDAAERLFCQQGFHATSMDEIARHCRVSKKTLYQLFQSKDELFATVVRSHCSAPAFPAEAALAEPGDTLVAMLLELSRVLLKPDTIALHRLVTIEAKRSSKLSQAIFQSGPSAGFQAMEDFLGRLKARGVCDIEEPTQAAKMLVGMALGEFHIRLLFNAGPRVTRQEVEARVRKAVEIFLRGTRPAANAGQGHHEPC